MKKKTVSILLMAAMAPSLAACGFSNSTDSSSKSSSKAEKQRAAGPGHSRKGRAAHPQPQSMAPRARARPARSNQHAVRGEADRGFASGAPATRC